MRRDFARWSGIDPVPRRQGQSEVGTNEKNAIDFGFGVRGVAGLVGVYVRCALAG